jgi:hypothetical protein
MVSSLSRPVETRVVTEYALYRRPREGVNPTPARGRLPLAGLQTLGLPSTLNRE